MSIKQAQQKLEDNKKNRIATQTRELWLRENDQAFISLLSSGNEEKVDNNFLLFFIRSETIKYDTGKEFTKKIFLAENEENIPEQYKRAARSQLGFWVFVHHIFHDTNIINGKVQETWKMEKTPSGIVRYREDVGDFKLYLGGLGKDQSFWNQLVDIHNEEGALNKKTLRIGKKGKGMNTFYSIAVATGEVLEIPKEKFSEIKDFPSVLEYVETHLVLNQASTTTVVNDTVASNTDDDDDESLF